MPAPESLETPEATLAQRPSTSKAGRLFLPLPPGERPLVLPLPVGERPLLPPLPLGERPLLPPLPLGEGWGEGLPGTHRPVTQESPESTQRRVQRLIQQLAQRIQARRLASVTALPAIAPRPDTPGATPGTLESPRSGPPPTSPPNPAHSAPAALLRRLFLPLPVGEGWGEGLPANHLRVTQESPESTQRLVADCPKPPRHRKVRA